MKRNLFFFLLLLAFHMSVLGQSSSEYILDPYGQNLPSTMQNRVSMPLTDGESNIFMIDLPFNVSSYYFGPDARIYEMASIPVVEYADGVITLFLDELNIDTIMNLPVSSPLLIKTRNAETKIQGARDLFKSGFVAVTPQPYSANIINSEGVILGSITSNIGYNQVWQSGNNATYVIDNGLLKRINSTEHMVPACRVFITLADDYANTSLELKSTKSSDALDMILESHARIQPLAELKGFVTFYSETSDFEICEEENGNPDAKVYTVMKPEKGTVLELHEVSDGLITKGNAVLLKAQTKGNVLKLRMVTNGSTDTEAYSGNILQGVAMDTPVSDLCDSGESFIYTLGTSPESNIVFQQTADTETLSANNAYIKASSLNGEKAYSLPTVITGVRSVKEGAVSPTEGITVYDINGMEVKDVKGDKIYIINNKKVIK